MRTSVLILALAACGAEPVTPLTPSIVDIDAPRAFEADGDPAAVAIHVIGEPHTQLSVVLDARHGDLASRDEFVITDRDGEAIFETTYTVDGFHGVETLTASVADFSGHTDLARATFEVTELARYGEPDALPGMTTLTTGFLLGQAIEIPARAELRRVGIGTLSGGISAIVGIYSDLDGAPNRLLAETGAAPLSIGTNEIDIEPVMLPRGTVWFLVKYSGQVAVRSSSAFTDTRYVSQAFTGQLPITVRGETTVFTGATYNYYVVAMPE